MSCSLGHEDGPEMPGTCVCTRLLRSFFCPVNILNGVTRNMRIEKVVALKNVKQVYSGLNGSSIITPSHIYIYIYIYIYIDFRAVAGRFGSHFPAFYRLTPYYYPLSVYLSLYQSSIIRYLMSVFR
jgi:hypothetical protein